MCDVYLVIDRPNCNLPIFLQPTVEDAVRALGLAMPKRRDMHHAYSTALPYGCWTCHNGREVLFNRGYRPIWRHCPGGSTERANPDEWVRWAKQEWFYGGSTGRLPPGRDRTTRDYMLQVLIEFGVRLGEPA